MANLEENKAVVRELLQLLNEKKLDRLTTVVSERVVDPNKIIFGEADEPGAALDGLRQQMAAFPDYNGRIDELVAEGNKVVARITQSGTHTGMHPRMPTPTNARFENELILVFAVEDRKIVEIRGVSDRLGMFIQLGWPWPTAD